MDQTSNQSAAERTTLPKPWGEIELLSPKATKHLITEEEFKLGRDGSSCSLVAEGSYIGRVQFLIRPIKESTESAEMVIKSKTNPTFVNKVKVETECQLKSGDVVTILHPTMEDHVQSEFRDTPVCYSNPEKTTGSPNEQFKMPSKPVLPNNDMHSPMSANQKRAKETSEIVSKHLGGYLKKESIDNYYTIVKEIGGGSFGTVYSVVSKEDGKLYALKKTRIMSRSAYAMKQRQMIIREFDILMPLRHENIVLAYCGFMEENSISIVMELINGGDLLGYVEKNRGISEYETQSILKQVCEGIKYLHCANIIHRDLKPENILISQNSQGEVIPKISDFGTAKMCQEGSMPQTVVGTMLFQAPEIGNGVSVTYTNRADIWSFGAIVYFLLGGKSPVELGNIQGSTLPGKSGQDKLFQGSCWNAISMEVRDLVKATLALNPKSRPSADDLLSSPWFKLSKSQLDQTRRTELYDRIMNGFNDPWIMQSQFVMSEPSTTQPEPPHTLTTNTDTSTSSPMQESPNEHSPSRLQYTADSNTVTKTNTDTPVSLAQTEVLKSPNAPLSNPSSCSSSSSLTYSSPSDTPRAKEDTSLSVDFTSPVVNGPTTRAKTRGGRRNQVLLESSDSEVKSPPEAGGRSLRKREMGSSSPPLQSHAKTSSDESKPKKRR